MPDALNWRDRVARAAAADVGRDADAKTISQARGLADRWLSGAVVGLCAFALLGGFSGYATTVILLRPADRQVDAAAALLGIVVLPWLCLTLRGIAMLLLKWRASLLLDWLAPIWLRRVAGRSAGCDATSQDLTAATTKRIGSMLAEGSKRWPAASNGRRLAAAGSGACWTVYALVAVATIWIATSRIAVGFGWEWESSWLPPDFGRAVVEVASAPLGAFVEGNELTPIAPAPIAPAADPGALAARQAWLGFLTAGVAVYVLLPMVVWTLWQVWMLWRADPWQPDVVTVARSAVTAATHRPEPVATPRGPPLAGGRVCTHVVRLERPEEATALPATLDRLADLGDVDAAADLERVEGILRARPARIAVVGWLPATPDRGVRRRLQALASASTEAPLLILDGGDVLRRAEPPHTAAIRLDDWRTLASQTGFTPFECDLAELTDASRRSLARTVELGADPDGGRELATASGSAAAGSGAERSELDPALLDAAFGVIGRHLDGADPLPSDAALASCLGEVARTFRARSGDNSPDDVWRVRLAALRELDSSGVSRRVTSLTRAGLGLLPAGLRTRAVWAGVGGLLGVAACAAAATIAPGALVALPGWAATGAGLAGLLSLARQGDDGTGSAQVAATAGSSSDAPCRLGEAVFAAAASAVLWWSQGGDEARTTRALEALAPDDAVPALDEADGARRWLATARLRVVAAAKGDT